MEGRSICYMPEITSFIGSFRSGESMIIFDGRYSWTGKKEGRRTPVAWFPGAYDLKIVDLSKKNKGATYIRPYLCIYANTGYGHSISAHPEKFIKRICGDFSLKIEKVLWVEQITDLPRTFEIIVFKKRGRLSTEAFYRVEKRKPTVGELVVITKECR